MSNNNTFTFLAANAESTTAFNKLSNSEFLNLLTQSKNGNLAARNELLLDNLGLIYKIARQIKNPYANFDELVSDGCIRFLELINDYNPAVAALSTYMWNPIMQYMNHNVKDYKAGLSQFVVSYKEAESFLFDKFGRQPNQNEIAEFMGLSLLQLKNRLEDVSDRNHISLYAPVNSADPESATLMDSFCCANTEDASYNVIKEDEKRCINLAWNRLSDNDRCTLMLRNSSVGKKLSLRDAAKNSGFSAETLRKRENEAKERFQSILDEYGIAA